MFLCCMNGALSRIVFLGLLYLYNGNVGQNQEFLAIHLCKIIVAGNFYAV